MSDLLFNNISASGFTDVNGVLPVNDDINANCLLSKQYDGISWRSFHPTAKPMTVGDNALTVIVRLKQLSDAGQFVVTQKDSESYTGDSIWEFYLGGTGANRHIFAAYRESVNGNFIFAQTVNGAFPNDANEHEMGMSLDITNKKLFITLDGAKPLHTFENLTGGTLSATAQGTMHKLSLGSRHADAFNLGQNCNISQLHTFQNDAMTVGELSTHYNNNQALVGTNPNCNGLTPEEINRATYYLGSSPRIES